MGPGRAGWVSGSRIAEQRNDVHNTGRQFTPPSPSSSTPVTTADILSRSLSPFHKHLKSVHINAQSLMAHIYEIKEIFKRNNVDIIGVSESWLKPSIQSKEVAMSGYTIFRNDRLNKIGGGVAVYIREELKPKLIYTSPSEYSAKPEFLFVEIGLSGVGALLLGVCYRPPKVGHLSDFENALIRLMPGYSRVLLMGDFNTDLLKDKHRYDYRLLTSMFESCNLTILPLQPTHHTAETDTLIDLMVFSDPQDIVHHGQLPIPSIPKHNLIHGVFIC